MTRSGFLILTALLLPNLLCGQSPDNDSTGFLVPERIEVAISLFEARPRVPAFEAFRNAYRYGHRFTDGSQELVGDSLFSPKSSYTGLRIGFDFGSDIFKDSTAKARNFFRFGFEAGGSDAILYNRRLTDSSNLEYRFHSDIFRLTLGYRYFITKKGRFRLFIGGEWINEFNISAVVFEKQYDSVFGLTYADRKLFADRGYSSYWNATYGFDYRPFGRMSVFVHGNYGIGYVVTDPLRQWMRFAGANFGVTFPL